MTIAMLPPSLDDAELEIASRCAYHYRSSDLSVDMLSGQPGSFTRAATATFLDSLGATCTAGYGQARFEPRVHLGATHFGLLMGTADTHNFPALWRPRTHASRWVGQQVGAMASAGKALLSISNDGVTGARLVLDSSGSFYRLTHHNGTSGVTVTLAVAPSNGQDLELWWQVYSDGSVQLWQSINGAAATNTVRSSALAFASAWGTGAVLRFGNSGTANAMALWLQRFRTLFGVPDYGQLCRTV